MAILVLMQILFFKIFSYKILYFILFSNSWGFQNGITECINAFGLVDCHLSVNCFNIFHNMLKVSRIFIHIELENTLQNFIPSEHVYIKHFLNKESPSPHCYLQEQIIRK